MPQGASPIGPVGPVLGIIPARGRLAVTLWSIRVTFATFQSFA